MKNKVFSLIIVILMLLSILGTANAFTPDLERGKVVSQLDRCWYMMIVHYVFLDEYGYILNRNGGRDITVWNGNNPILLTNVTCPAKFDDIYNMFQTHGSDFVIEHDCGTTKKTDIPPNTARVKVATGLAAGIASHNDRFNCSLTPNDGFNIYQEGTWFTGVREHVSTTFGYKLDFGAG